VKISFTRLLWRRQAWAYDKRCWWFSVNHCQSFVKRSSAVPAYQTLLAPNHSSRMFALLNAWTVWHCVSGDLHAIEQWKWLDSSGCQTKLFLEFDLLRVALSFHAIPKRFPTTYCDRSVVTCGTKGNYWVKNCCLKFFKRLLTFLSFC